MTTGLAGGGIVRSTAPSDKESIPLSPNRLNANDQPDHDEGPDLSLVLVFVHTPNRLRRADNMYPSG
jgi:hypothetical protein